MKWVQKEKLKKKEEEKNWNKSKKREKLEFITYSFNQCILLWI